MADQETFPKETNLDDLMKTLAKRLKKGAVSVLVEKRGDEWLVTTDWGDDL